MCTVCAEISSMSQEAALARIAKALAKGGDPDHLSRLIDGVLGILPDQVDSELDEEYERRYRGGGG